MLSSIKKNLIGIEMTKEKSKDLSYMGLRFVKENPSGVGVSMVYMTLSNTILYIKFNCMYF